MIQCNIMNIFDDIMNCGSSVRGTLKYVHNMHEITNLMAMLTCFLNKSLI